MRRIATLVLFVAGLGCLAPRAEAQIVSPPTIRSVSSTNAFDPGRIVIHGTSLGIVTQVLIAGEVVPIVKNTGSRLSVQPPPEDPGFATLEVRSILGPVFGTVEFTPTVTATRNHPAVNRMTVVLHGGDVGTYQVLFSYRQVMTPTVLAGVYFHRLLDLTPAVSGFLASGTFTDATTPVSLNKFVPVLIGLVGQPLYLQAQCNLGTGPSTSTFTNLFTLPGLTPLP